jgi:excisionase family DNA binding protein
MTRPTLPSRPISARIATGHTGKRSIQSSSANPPLAKAALTINEWCELWRVGRNTAYNEIARGELQTIRIGGRRLVTIEQNAAYAARKMSAT